VSRRADVVDGGILSAHTCLPNVANLQTVLAAVMGSGHRTAATAEETFLAFCCWRGESLRAAVITRCAHCTLGNVGEARAVTEGAVGTQELGGEASTSGAEAASGTDRGSGGVLQAEGAGGTGPAGALRRLVLVSARGAYLRSRAAGGTVSAGGAVVDVLEGASAGGAEVVRQALARGEDVPFFGQ